MFCPKCATQNMDNARFCRACGADISLVPQAMSGALTPVQPADLEATDQGLDSRGRRRRRRQRGEPTPEKAFKNLFMGLGFLIVAIILGFSRMGAGWWFWMFIPAFSMIGGGVAEMVRLRIEKGSPSSGAAPAYVPSASVSATELPPRSTSELMPPPPSVTEGTTRHLGSEGPTEYLATPRGKSEKKV
jgi:hypothetical protein